VKSADDGRFLISNVTPGVYVLVVKSPGFKNLELTALAVAGKETANVEAILLPTQEGALVGVVADTSTIDTKSSSITTIISEKMIRSLPIP
jgi:hypothetical protein